MSQIKWKRLLAFSMSVLLFAGSVIPAFAADSSSSGSSSLQDITSILNTNSYLKYAEKYKDIPDATKAITIDVTDYVDDEKLTTADIEIVNNYNNRAGSSIKVGASGRVTWQVTVPKDGMYVLEIDYCSVTEKTTSIERTLYINEIVPFSEARLLEFSKRWLHNYNEENGRFNVDSTGSEMRPTTNVEHVWSTYTMNDPNGYISDPLRIYLKAGDNTITLEAIREEVVLGEIRLMPKEELPSYADILAEYEAKGYKPVSSDATVRLEAELPSAVSNYTIYPQSDRTSAMTYPQHATSLMLNNIGGGNWQSAGQWIEYTFTAKESGLYNIVTRYKQSSLDGLFVSRTLKINGEVPFEEAYACQFNYGSKWNTTALNNGDETFVFYFEEGKEYTITFEVTLGYMGSIIAQVTDVLNSINDDYLSIIKLTGSDPDEYRDYNFAGVMPDTIRDLAKQADALEAIITTLTEMNNVKGSNISTLEQCKILLRKMSSDEDQIAKNLSSLKTYVSSLSSWVSTVNSQSLQLDYIQIQGTEEALPKAETSWWKSIWYQLMQFFGSFFSDYNSMGTGEAGDVTTIEVWLNTGRDQAQIVRNIVDNNYSSAHPDAKINLKLVASGTLLPSVLAGAGPDVALGEADAIQYAIRGAVEELNGFDTFDQVITRFSSSAVDSLSLYGKTYGLPATQEFMMLFYRKDILAELGVDIPRTWDDMLALIPVLNYNNMTIGIPYYTTVATSTQSAVSNIYPTFLYQMGGDMWTDDGMRINLDSNTALEAFEYMCNMYTQYSLETTFDAANRFKTGEMPLMIANYTTYNNLVLFAAELAGLWGFTSLPGIEQEDGTINNVGVSSATGITMMRGVTDRDKAWDFMDWYTDKFFQVNYSNELVAVMGEAAKNPTANIEALEELDWTAEEYKELYAQFTNLVAVPPYPGTYIISRYLEFAFLSAYNDYANPTEELQSYVNAINKEITRKRKEFKLETVDIGDTLARKRIRQTSEFLSDLSEPDKSKYSDVIATVNNAIENASITTLTGAIEVMKSADAAFFATPIEYLDKAVEMLVQYQK